MVFGLGKRELVVGKKEYDKVVKGVNEIRKGHPIVLAENYAGGVKYARPIEAGLDQLGVPYEVCEVKMQRPDTKTNQPGRILQPSWKQYEEGIHRLGDSYHFFFDDNISEEAFGALFWRYWLRVHGIPDEKIKTVGVVDASGHADLYIVRAFENRLDIDARNAALEQLIEKGSISTIDYRDTGDRHLLLNILGEIMYGRTKRSRAV